MASSSGTRQRSISNRQETPQIVLPKGKDNATEAEFDPCAATAAHFLYPQGSAIAVVEHDSLKLQRRFTGHAADISFISVDNVSERGNGRLVVSYDKAKTAIVWDLYSAKQICLFSSYEPLLVAAWMRNGNIAFGNEVGEVILFEPASSDHVSSRTINDPITALAPSTDCKTYAIGYRNGTIILASLQPQFAVLHTLNTTRSSSPISQLCWHASSSKQKSDMLAIQTQEGDLRVWSVTKPPGAGPPRIIRILKREARFLPGRTWIAWAKNGRVLQFSEGETWAWDVRTKDVTYAPVATVEYVKGIAAHGATAALFTLGPDNTVQQYDIDSGHMIGNQRHIPPTIPPTPPAEHTRQFLNDETASNTSSQRYEDEQRRHVESPRSYPSKNQLTEPRKAEKRPVAPVDVISPSQTEKTATTFSVGAYYGPPQTQVVQPVQAPYVAPSSPATSRTGGMRKGSRLRQEVVLSPQGSEDVSCADLFPFTRARLSDVPYSQSRILDERRTTSHDLRQQMLSVIFGWEHDIRELLEDELARQPADSVNAVLLMRWLSDESEAMAEAMRTTSADPSLDWLRLALGMLDGRPETKQLAQIFVEKMLSKGEIHMAVVVLLATGDRNGAIEVYVTRNCYLEAILLTCLLMPGDWQRQSYLVRKWGEHVVHNSQQQLAIRCFSCTGIEPADPWVSPTAQLFHKVTSPIAQILQQAPTYEARPTPQPAPPLNSGQAIMNRKNYPDTLSPLSALQPPAQRPTVRMTPQKGGLKLITSFAAPKNNQYQFPGLQSEDHTPINREAVTPIAESAISRSALSPGGLGSYRANNVRSINDALATARDSRSRLASIGETPVDIEPSSASFTPRARTSEAQTPIGLSSDRSERAALKLDTSRPGSRTQRSEQPPSLLTSARYDPNATPVQDIYSPEMEPQTALRPSLQAFSRNDTMNVVAEEDEAHISSGHRSKKPDGMSLQILPVRERSDSKSKYRNADPVTRPSTTDSRATERTDFNLTPPLTSDSYRLTSPSVSGRSIDQYISSLEQAQYHDQARTQSRNSSRQPKEGRRRSKTRKQKYDDAIEVRSIPSSKRSPTSPVPMSPDDIRMLSVASLDSVYNSANTSNTNENSSSTKHRRKESTSTAGGRHRNRSRSTTGGARRKASISVKSGRATPAEDHERGQRGRSKSRKEGVSARSPSSPLPMVPSEDDLQGRSSVDAGSAFRFVSQDRSRLQRSVSRRPTDRGTSARRDQSPDRRRHRERSPSRQRDRSSSANPRKNSLLTGERYQRDLETTEDDHDLEATRNRTIEKLDNIAASSRREHEVRSIVDKRRELAQAELEARRLSLARRPSAPPIPLPGQVAHAKSISEGTNAPPPLQRQVSESLLRSTPRNMSRQQHSETGTMTYMRDRPGTPRAMERPNDEEETAFREPEPVLEPEPEPEPEPIDNSTFLLPARTYTPMGTPVNSRTNHVASESRGQVVVPHIMPRHPAFDPEMVGNRAPSTNGTRGVSPDAPAAAATRGRPREQEARVSPVDAPIVIGSPVASGTEVDRLSMISNAPAIIPELQHLLIPPPPPPPPAFPLENHSHGLVINTDLNSAINIPLPQSAYPTDYPLTAKSDMSSVHKRGKSTIDGPFTGKLRGITDRLRSASKTRDNNSRSPAVDESFVSPYETDLRLMSPPLETVLERREGVGSRA